MQVSCFSFIFGNYAGAPLKIIPARNFNQIRMHSGEGNHLWEDISSNQDAFGRRKSSLRGILIKSGCIRAKEIIPARKFHQIRMHSGEGNHLWEEFPSNQDEFGRWKSSLRESLIKSGCIRAKEIIPGRNFHQIRMNSAVGNHPCEKISSNQDAFCRKKSSLDEYSAKSGCIWLSQLFRIFIHWIPAA